MNLPSCSIHRQCNSPPTGIPIYKSRIPPPSTNLFSSTSSSSNSSSLNQLQHKTSIFIDHDKEAFHYSLAFFSPLHSLHVIHCLVVFITTDVLAFITTDVLLLRRIHHLAVFTDSAIHHRQASSSIKAESPPRFFFSSTSSSSSNTKITHPSTLHRPYHHANYTSLHILYMTIPSLIVVVLNEHRSTLIFQYIYIHGVFRTRWCNGTGDRRDCCIRSLISSVGYPILNYAPYLMCCDTPVHGRFQYEKRLS